MSGLPHEEILGPRGEDEIVLQRARRLGCRGDALDRMRKIVDRLVGVAGVILDRAAGKACRLRGENGLGGTDRAVALCLSRDRPKPAGWSPPVTSRQWWIIASNVTAPSGRPREKAKPALVVASALKPKRAKQLGVPHPTGLGMTKVEACRSRKILPLSMNASPSLCNYEADSNAPNPPGQTNAVGSETFGVLCCQFVQRVGILDVARRCLSQ